MQNISLLIQSFCLNTVSCKLLTFEEKFHFKNVHPLCLLHHQGSILSFCRVEFSQFIYLFHCYLGTVTRKKNTSFCFGSAKNSCFCAANTAFTFLRKVQMRLTWNQSKCRFLSFIFSHYTGQYTFLLLFIFLIKFKQ